MQQSLASDCQSLASDYLSLALEDVLDIGLDSGGLRHGRAGPLPRAPRFEGAPQGPPGAPRAEPALRMGEWGHSECTETFLYE